MRKLYYIILVSLLTVFTTACSENEIVEQAQSTLNESKSVITAHVPNEGSRVAFNDNGAEGISITWKENDKINLLVNIRGPQSEGNSNYNYTNYIFTHSSGNQFTGDIAAKEGTEFYAYYPVTNTDWRLPSEIPFNIESQSGKLDETKTYMYAANVNATYEDVLSFRHLTAIMKAKFIVNETNITNSLTKVEIQLPNNVFTSGTIDLTDNISINGSSTTIIVTPEQLDLLYIYLPKGLAIGNELKLTAYTDKKCYMGKLTTQKTIEPGKVYPCEIILNEENKIWFNGIEMATPSKGTGTNTDPYQIATAAELQWLVEKHYTLGSQANGSGVYYKLMENLTINSSKDNPWKPIGNLVNTFSGNFNGNNKTISGSLISEYAPGNIPSDQWITFGLFGSSNGKIEKLNVNAIVVGGTTTGNIMASVTGGIVGTYDGIRGISNCSFTGNVTGGTSNTGYASTGGIAGNLGMTGRISNCTNSASIQSINENGSSYIGGIAGYSEGFISASNNTGNIIAEVIHNKIYIGGLIGGQLWGNVSEGCTNSGKIYTNNNHTQISKGGLIGHITNGGGITAIVCTCCGDTGNPDLALIGNNESLILDENCNHSSHNN